MVSPVFKPKLLKQEILLYLSYIAVSTVKQPAYITNEI